MHLADHFLDAVRLGVKQEEATGGEQLSLANGHFGGKENYQKRKRRYNPSQLGRGKSRQNLNFEHPQTTKFGWANLTKFREHTVVGNVNDS